MTKHEFSALLSKGPLLLDGATGSNLLKMGMPRGIPTELWLEDHPQAIIQLQQAYAEAGSQVLYAPTFLANRISMQKNIPAENMHARLRDLNLRAVEHCRLAAQGRALVAGDIGGTGTPMQPYGPLSYEEVFACFTEQISFFSEAGVDLIVIETMVSPEEAAAILDAASSVCRLPVLVSLTCESDGSLFFGGNIFDAASSLADMGADAVGCNCSVGPEQLESVIATIADRVNVPVIAKPNAGLPEILPSGEAVYHMTPEEFAVSMKQLYKAGASLLGGCCGTDPSYIQALKRISLLTL